MADASNLTQAEFLQVRSEVASVIAGNTAGGYRMYDWTADELALAENLMAAKLIDLDQVTKALGMVE